jgi:hypothetical protein
VQDAPEGKKLGDWPAGWNIARRRSLDQDVTAGLENQPSFLRGVRESKGTRGASTTKAFFLVASIILNDDLPIRKKLGFFPTWASILIPWQEQTFGPHSKE